MTMVIVFILGGMLVTDLLLVVGCSVLRNSLDLMSYKDINEHTLERRGSTARSVTKDLCDRIISQNTSRHTMLKKPL